MYGWINGRAIPFSWERLQVVVNNLQLSKEEETELKNGFERTRLGEEGYAIWQKMVECFQIQLQKDEKVIHSEEKCCFAVKKVELPEIVFFKNKMDIFRGIQTVLDYMRVQMEQRLYLKMHSMHTEIMLFLKMFCYSAKECEIEEIVFLTREKERINVHNLEVLKNIAELMAQKREIDVYCSEEVYCEKDFSDNWMISNAFVLWYDEALSSGMLTTNPVWIQFFRKRFEKIKESCYEMGEFVK